MWSSLLRAASRPSAWSQVPPKTDSYAERLGTHVYSGLFECQQVKEYLVARSGKVHIVEMGCGNGAGANHICTNVLPNCTYEAVDMQQAAINTCERKFVPALKGRLRATQAR